MEYFYGGKGEGVMVFKGNEGGISHRQQSVKWECKKLTANQPRTKGGGGGESRVITTLQSVMRRSGKFYRDIIKVLRPFPPRK